MSALLDGITWFRGSSVRIRRAGMEIHVDPWGLPEPGDADIILLTHPHYDNFSEDDIARVRTEQSVVVAPTSMRNQLSDAGHLMHPGDLVQLEGVDILAVPAYNVEKKFHPEDSAWLGYVFTVGDVTYYHAGDTDYLESMNAIRCDVAFLPCDGHYTMGPEEAARAGMAVGAQAIVPVRWGDTGASLHEVERLKDLFPGEVRVLERTA